MFYGSKGILTEHSAQTSISHLTRERLMRMPIPNPPRLEQQAVAGMVDRVDVTIAEAKKELEGFKLLNESTADALLTGRVRVGPTGI